MEHRCSRCQTFESPFHFRILSGVNVACTRTTWSKTTHGGLWGPLEAQNISGPSIWHTCWTCWTFALSLSCSISFFCWRCMLWGVGTGHLWLVLCLLPTGAETKNLSSAFEVKRWPSVAREGWNVTLAMCSITPVSILLNQVCPCYLSLLAFSSFDPPATGILISNCSFAIQMNHSSIVQLVLHSLFSCLPCRVGLFFLPLLFQEPRIPTKSQPFTNWNRREKLNVWEKKNKARKAAPRAGPLGSVRSFFALFAGFRRSSFARSDWLPTSFVYHPFVLARSKAKATHRLSRHQWAPWPTFYDQIFQRQSNDTMFDYLMEKPRVPSFLTRSQQKQRKLPIICKSLQIIGTRLGGKENKSTFDCLASCRGDRTGLPEKLPRAS